MAFVCARCDEGTCNKCIDIMRVIVDLKEICKCERPGHDGEPVHNQILDPETGDVHGPGMVIRKDGTTERTDHG